MKTEIGRISQLLSTVNKVETPLEERLARLGVLLIKMVVGIGSWSRGWDHQGRGIARMIETGIALAVAAIPGLPLSPL